jgi:acylphosphatase
MVERRLVHFSGWVQGVGFRYTAQHLARRYAVSGYVRNLADGRVELVVEGEPDELDRYLDELSSVMKRYIRETKVQRGPATGEFRGFEIRY